jgi:hypothetical protein
MRLLLSVLGVFSRLSFARFASRHNQQCLRPVQKDACGISFATPSLAGLMSNRLRKAEESANEQELLALLRPCRDEALSIADCYARAVSAHGTTVSPMNSRRLMGFIPLAENHHRKNLIRPLSESYPPNRRQFGAIRTEPRNLLLRRTAWWGWEDSNFQPTDYQPPELNH